MKNLRLEIRNIIETHEFEDVETKLSFLNTFAGIVEYIESKVPLLKYYNKNNVFAQSEVMKYHMEGKVEKRQISVQNSIMTYEVAPSSDVYIIWNSFRSLKIEIENNIIFKLLSETDPVEKDAVSRVLHKNLSDHSFTKFIRYSPAEMDTFKQQLDEAIHEVNKSMVLFDEVMKRNLGYSLI